MNNLTLLQQWIEDFGENEKAAEDRLEWVQENCASMFRAAAANGSRGNADELWFDALTAVLKYQGAPALAVFYLKSYIWRSSHPLADDLLAHESPADWWRAAGISRQLAYKMANDFCDRLSLPRRPTQRTLSARKKMRLKRLAITDRSDSSDSSDKKN